MIPTHVCRATKASRAVLGRSWRAVSTHPGCTLEDSKPAGSPTLPRCLKLRGDLVSEDIKYKVSGCLQRKPEALPRGETAVDPAPKPKSPQRCFQGEGGETLVSPNCLFFLFSFPPSPSHTLICFFLPSGCGFITATECAHTTHLLSSVLCHSSLI